MAENYESRTAGLRALWLELIDLYSFLEEESHRRGIICEIEPHSLSNFSTYVGNSESLSNWSAFIIFFKQGIKCVFNSLYMHARV